jgi:hypothetical protein
MSFPFCLTRDDMHAFDTLDLLPLRQTVRPAHLEACGLGSQGLLGGLSRPARFRLLRCGPGVQILARDAHALSEAQHLLRQAYGASIAFGTPTALRAGADHATGALR